MQIGSNCGVNNKQVSFGYNYSDLAKDVASKTKKFVCTVPPKEDVKRAIRTGFIEAPKFILCQKLPLDALEILLKTGYSYLTTKKSFTSIEGYLMTGPKGLKLIKDNPFNVIGQCLFNDPIAKTKAYFSQFK